MKEDWNWEAEQRGACLLMDEKTASRISWIGTGLSILASLPFIILVFMSI